MRFVNLVTSVEKATSKTATRRATAPFNYIHSDLCGPITPTSPSDTKYILTFTDDFSRFTWIYFLKKKSHTLSVFKQFQALVDGRHNRKVLCLRTDGGGEYSSVQFASHCADHGIHHEFTQAHTPHQNGVAERKNRTLLERAWCLLFGGSIPTYLWSELVATANYLINRAPPRANIGVTPYQRLYRHRPGITSLRVIGSVAFVKNVNPQLPKLASRTIKSV